MHPPVSGGGLVRAKGAGEVGKSYFIQDGKLDGEAPALTGLTMEV